MTGTITKKIQSDIMCIQIEEYNTTYELVVSLVGMGIGVSESDSKPQDPINNNLKEIH